MLESVQVLHFTDCLIFFVNHAKFSQVITGYLLAGSFIGPGGFSFISEMVQVCCFFL